MALYTVGSIDTIAGEGFGGANTVTVKKVLQELGQLKRSILDGFANDTSAAISGMSAAGGDTLLSVVMTTSAGGHIDLTGSSSISNDRLLIVDTTSVNTVLNVMWYDRSGNVST